MLIFITVQTDEKHIIRDDHARLFPILSIKSSKR